MAKIVYLNFWDDMNEGRKRKCYLSCVNKAHYILDILKENESVPIEIVSCSGSAEKKGSKGCAKQIDDNVSFRQFRTFGCANKAVRLLEIIYIKLCLIFYFLFSVNKNDTVIVYHSLFYCSILKYLKLLKNFKMVLELEELYSDVIGNSKKKKSELKLCHVADAFIFPTIMLNDVANKVNKPYCVAHGTYKVEDERKVSFDDSKIHVVYAGTLDMRKGGALAAASAAEFLDERYVVHILGFGPEKSVAHIKQIVKDINKKTKATVIYEGVLQGEAYIEFIQKCHIGLSVQNPDAEFNGTSFPSKILSYMSNGLRVVSVDIPAITGSAVNGYLYYYQKQTPENIAGAIKSIDMNDEYDGRYVVRQLNERFGKELKELLKGVGYAQKTIE